MKNTNFFSCAIQGSVLTRVLRQALTGVAIIAALNGPASAADPATTTIVEEGQQGVAPAPVTFRRLGVIVVDFPDTPETMRAKFPTQAQWADIVRSDNLKQYFSVQSNHVFKYTTEILGVFRSAIPGWDPATGNAVQLDEIQARNNFNIPNFNANKYDELVLVSIHDAALPASQGGILRLNINGKYLEKTGFFVAAQVGIWGRRSDYTYFSSLVAKDGFMIHAPNGQGVMGIVRLPLTRFERTFAHEFFHSMNTIPHVMTATNGTLPAHLPYNREAQCPSPCYVSDYTLQRLYYGLEYGNKFDVMGHTEYSQTLNAVFRDTLGWLNAKTRVSIKGYGKKTFIVSPEHFYDSTRAIEIRIPYKYAPTSDRRNQGYFLEARSAANPFNGMLVHPMLKGNTEGLFVFKTNGATSTLLDMSPSANIIIGGTSVVPDLRDVVLKPGMTYENSEIRLSNVRKFNSGHFAVDVEVLR